MIKSVVLLISQVQIGENDRQAYPHHERNHCRYQSDQDVCLGVRLQEGCHKVTQVSELWKTTHYFTWKTVHVTSFLYTLSCRSESLLILKGGIARALTQAFNLGIVVPVMMALTFIVFTATGGELTPRRVFTTLSLIGFLRRSSVAFLVRCFFLVYEARVALVRIQVSPK